MVQLDECETAESIEPDFGPSKRPKILRSTRYDRQPAIRNCVDYGIQDPEVSIVILLPPVAWRSLS
jgi:hypothetical protein